MPKFCFDIFLLCLLCLFSVAASRPSNSVQQTFPKNATYSCRSPNINLQCTFSQNPVTASWTVSVNGNPEQVTPSTPGHTVNATEIQNGILYLMVNSSVYSKDNLYSCTAVYADGDTEVSDVFVTPTVENISAPIRDLVVTATQDTITVKWNHDYYLCRNFTIYLNDNAVPECTNITALNCTIENLDTGMLYEVRVVATEFGIEPAEASVMIAVQGRNAGTRCGYIGMPVLLLLVWTVKMMAE